MAVADLIVAEAKARNGRLFITDRHRFNESLRTLDERWPLQVTVTRLRATRSLAQNRYFWSTVIHTLSEHTGYSADEMHDLLKAMFLPKALAICDGNGEVKGEYVIGGSTRTLNTKEFMDYCARIQQWASETLHVYIPDPGEL